MPMNNKNTNDITVEVKKKKQKETFDFFGNFCCRIFYVEKVHLIFVWSKAI